jgi:guanylate kinase
LSKGILIVLSGPSGVGKTTICNTILAKRSDIRYSVSATSRKKREGEQEHREYIFLTEREFMEWIDRGMFVEYARVHGNYYGTPKNALDEHLENGFHVLMDVDVQGAKKLMGLYPDGLYFFIVPPDFKELEKRLLKRNTEKNEVLKNRLARAAEEIQYKNDYKYIIENRDLDETVCEILSIIEKELGQP